MTRLIVSLPLLLILSGALHAAVKITVPTDAPTIQSALEKSHEGDTIFLKNGTYKESIVLKDQITLIGESTHETIIDGNGKGAVIRSSDGSTISNLTIENGEKGIVSENKKTTIENVIVRNNKGSGIHCLMSLPTIRNSAIYRNKWSGIYCESVKNLNGSLENNIIAENGYSGISLAGKTEIIIQHNIIFSNKQYGIWVSDDSRKSRIVYNNFFGNRNALNSFAQNDRSNISANPGLTSGSQHAEVDYFVTVPSFQDKGRDGAAIGIVSASTLKQKSEDSDNDGIPSDIDKCLSIAEDIDGFEDDDGCPDFDNDKDGIYDSVDKCPNEPEEIDGFEDDDGCPDFDNDQDGIPDTTDKCPLNEETVNGYNDEDGCPDENPETNQNSEIK